MDVKALTDEQRFFMDGEIVWSWRPKDWRFKFSEAEASRDAVANGRVHRGERV